jgi:hypothetical protein
MDAKLPTTHLLQDTRRATPKWTLTEDRTITQLRRRQKSWERISLELKGRSPRLCQERHAYLKSERKKALTYAYVQSYSISVIYSTYVVIADLT